MINGDGSGKRVLWSAPGILAASWSPGGAKLAVEYWDGNDSELYAVAAQGATKRRLTRNDVDDSAPIWSPRGVRIAFTRFADGSNDVWTMKADGTGKRRLTTGPRHESASDWAEASA